MCARHAPSQSRTCAAAATSPTTSLVAAGLYASTHSRLAPSRDAGPLARISPSRRRSSPRVSASAPETIAAAFQRPSPASTNFAASVSVASSSSSRDKQTEGSSAPDVFVVVIVFDETFVIASSFA